MQTVVISGLVQYGLLVVRFKVHYTLMKVNWFGTSSNLTKPVERPKAHKQSSSDV